MVFPVVMYGYESWPIKKAEHRRIDAFELWCWRRLLRVPWTVRIFNKPILKEISPRCSLVGLILKLKLQYFGYLIQSVDLLEKDLMLGKIAGRRRRRQQRMRRLDGITDSHSIGSERRRIDAFELWCWRRVLRVPWTAARQASVFNCLGICSNSCPLSRWYYPAVSSSIAPFSSCPQSFPASGSFSGSHLFASGGQNFGASSSPSVLPINIQYWFPSGLTGLISLLSKGLSTVFSSTTVWKHQFFGTQPSLQSNSHPYMTTGKSIALTRQNFVSKVISLLFNTLSRFFITFLPRSNHLLISWLQSPSTVILESKKMKSVTVSTFFPSIVMKWWDQMSWS